MQISDRIENILGKGSDGWDVDNKAKRMVRDGHDVTELTIGEHDILTDPIILEAMNEAAMAGHTGYTAIPGYDALRAAVAKRIQTQSGVPTSAENVLITPGCQSALFAAHMITCNPGDTALFVDPYYATYPGTIRAASANPVAIKASAKSGFQPRAEDFGDAAKTAVSLLINTPNNPTGVVYSKQTLEGIAQVCIENDLWLISDEVYDSQIWKGQHISPRSLDGMVDRTLVVGSVSKSHAMTGSRIGWVVGPENIIAHLQNLSTHTNYGVAGFIQYAAVAALKLGPEFEAKISEPFRRRRDIALRIVAKSNIVTAIPANGSMYVMLDVRATGLSGDAFANQLLDTHKIAVMPGESFGNAASGHIRVALTVDDARLAEALETLIEFAENLSK